jgi:hypothetical protein
MCTPDAPPPFPNPETVEKDARAGQSLFRQYILDAVRQAKRKQPFSVQPEPNEMADLVVATLLDQTGKTFLKIDNWAKLYGFLAGMLLIKTLEGRLKGFPRVHERPNTIDKCIHIGAKSIDSFPPPVSLVGPTELEAMDGLLEIALRPYDASQRDTIKAYLNHGNIFVAALEKNLSHRFVAELVSKFFERLRQLLVAMRT